MESCGTLLSRDLKRNLFNLFATWCGNFSKPLGIISHINQNAEEEKLQFSALQVCIDIIFKLALKIITCNLILFLDLSLL